MLPPVLEIYVVWHPLDTAGAQLCDEFLEHFHGNAFSGLIGGAIEVYARSTGWASADDSPRPIPFVTHNWPGKMSAARFVAVVPILGNGFANAAQQETSQWRSYAEAIMSARAEEKGRVEVFPFVLHPSAVDGTRLGEIFGGVQRIAANAVGEGDTAQALRCRDLAQGIAQSLSEQNAQRLTVFISHTKRSAGEGEDVASLVASVRRTIGDTRLAEFFDANDLQPGRDWEPELRDRAATSALLALRTHLYASREWCQREVLIAKRQGMPVIVIDVLDQAEERGSFLMDHVPRVPVRHEAAQWSIRDIRTALNILVDECLKRVLWMHQAKLGSQELDFGISWWAPHAPEPITLSKWIEEERRAGRLAHNGEDVRILHPDPPLGADELKILQEMLDLSGIDRGLDVMTPRILAARGG